MRTVLFDQPVLDVLASPWRWRIVSSLYEPDVEPVDDRAHIQWMTQEKHQHQNSHEEILVSLAGSGVYGLQGKVYPCQPGTVFLFNQTDYHDTGYPQHASGMTHLWIHMMEGSAYALVQKICGGTTPQIVCRVDIYEESVALRLLTQIWRDLRVSRTVRSQLAQPQLIAALYLVVLEIAERTRSEPSANESFSKRVIRRITDHVALNGELSASIDDLALMAGYSKYHFARLFRKHTGQTVHHFLDGCRLSRANDMLEQGYRRKQVAAALGFQHESSFSRWHKIALAAASGAGRKKRAPSTR